MKQWFDVFKGVDTNVSDKQLQGTSFSRLDNAIVGEPKGTLKKRDGYDAMSATGSLSASNNPILSLTKRNDEVIAIQQNQIYSYSPASFQWYKIEDEHSAHIRLRNEDLTRGNFTQKNYDLDIMPFLNGHIAAAVWENEKDNSCYVKIWNIDEDGSGAILLPPTKFISTGYRPRVVFASSDEFCYLFAWDGGSDLEVYKINLAEANLSVSSVTTISVGTGLYDVIYESDIQSFYIVYENNVNNFILVKYSGKNGTVQNSTTVQTSLSENKVVRLISFMDTLGTPIVATTYGDGANQYYSRYNATDLSSIDTHTNIFDGFNTLNMTRCAMMHREGTDWIDFVFEEYDGYNSQLYAQSVSGTTLRVSTVNASDPIYNNAGLACDGISRVSGTYIPIVYEASGSSFFNGDSFDNTVFWITTGSNPTIIASGLHGEAGNITGSFVCSKKGKINDTFIFPVPEKSRFQTRLTEQDEFFTSRGVSLFYYKENQIMETLNYQNQTYFAGGTLSKYDGNFFYEQSFPVPPMIIGTTNATVITSSLDEAYSYKAIYEYVDSLGNIIRSAPSTALFVSASTATNINIQVVTAVQSNKPTGSMSCKLYRTELNGTIHYLVSSSADVTNGSTLNMVDYISDAELISNEPLYSDGENIADPVGPCHALAIHNERMFVCPSDRPSTIMYSKPITTDLDFEFSREQIIHLPEKGGEIEKLISHNGFLYVFKRNAVFLLQGEGPDATGAGQQFQEPQILTNVDVGTISQQSVISTPVGIMFQSNRGILSINGGELSFIGAPVREYTTGTVSSAVVDNKTRTARFTLTGSSGNEPMLVYNYEFNQWATFTNLGAKHGMTTLPRSSDPKHYILSHDGQKIGEQNLSSKTDGFKNSNYSLKFTTGWLSLADIQGRQLIRYFSIIGAKKSPCRMRVRVYYDYNNSLENNNRDEYIINVDGLFSNQINVRQRLGKQKCTAIKFEIEDIGTSDTNPASNDAYEIDGLALEFKINPDKIYRHQQRGA